MTEDIPEWAWDKAEKLVSAEIINTDYRGRSMAAFARLIAETQEPPVDPDLIKAREIATEYWRDVELADGADPDFTTGLYDETSPVQVALATLKWARQEWCK